MLNIFQIIPISFGNCQVISKSFIRDDVGCVGFCQEQFGATRLWLENLEKSQVTEWMYLPLCTSVNLNLFLHGKSNPCLNAWTSGWLGGGPVKGRGKQRRKGMKGMIVVVRQQLSPFVSHICMYMSQSSNCPYSHLHCHKCPHSS